MMNAATTNSRVSPPSERELLTTYSTREEKLARIREIERRLAKWEAEDEENDPELIRGHIRLTRGFRMGCGVFWFCLSLMCVRTAMTGHLWAGWLGALFFILGVVLLLRGILYRPDPQLILSSYEPHRGQLEYRRLVGELEILSRAFAQELQAEDAE